MTLLICIYRGKRPSAGLGGILDKINKKPKMGTLVSQIFYMINQHLRIKRYQPSQIGSLAFYKQMCQHTRFWYLSVTIHITAGLHVA